MPFNSTWHELLTQLDELFEEASMITPLSHRQFQITSQEQRSIISFDEDGDQPL